MMLENRRLIATLILWCEANSRKAIENSVYFRASVALLLLVSITACSGNETDSEVAEHIQIRNEIPEHIQEIKNLTIFPGDSEPVYDWS